ncbi:hypothetical protein PSH47_15975 [Pseudoalteromonas sp. CST5]|uniref:hypothetical protein n=1 Tax=unclassified Pseudoalteromonas TaxID=194690 RepID=UPI002359E285|nr:MULTISPECIES: hypothetical protein [unclassified Pseudoalteromonas]MDC9514493.1 hypothetical protein [Pseudoalteromonas sp. CST1]MDC9538939.1 hypothetical protein [Pseudoalteromonas sp. CST3]MDC9543149.1 hypothetical protein [Pseudoalteromonas sp. CST2]MDC9545852.1 hypothetical protein [Pseudoalteromonas sp. CST4]MDC9550632.1 hypothetical protein [Pseudoalteromonas sp. CST5]
MSYASEDQKNSIEPVHVQLSKGKRVVCSITMDFTKALRHYSDSPEAAYKLLCEYASHTRLEDGTLLDLDHVVELKRFVNPK